MTLEKEQAYFAQIKERLLEHYAGKVALIYDGALVGVWDSQERAYIAGIEKFGNVPFLIKHIIDEDPVESIPTLFIGLTQNADIPPQLC